MPRLGETKENQTGMALFQSHVARSPVGAQLTKNVEDTENVPEMDIGHEGDSREMRGQGEAALCGAVGR